MTEIELKLKRYDWLREHIFMIGSGPRGMKTVQYRFQADKFSTEYAQKTFDRHIDKAIAHELQEELTIYGAD